MSRDVNDPRIVEILAAFDRQRTSARCDAGMLAGCVLIVADIGVTLDAWDADALRAILTAFALHCPDGELDDMVTKAREQNEWIAAFERGAA